VAKDNMDTSRVNCDESL
jgi:hypothetical protein